MAWNYSGITSHPRRVMAMDLHFTIRLFIVGIALIWVLTPMLRHWREG